MEKLETTLKGKAFLSAVSSGLIPETEDGFDEERFERFWESMKNDAYSSYPEEKANLDKIFEGITDLEAEEKRGWRKQVLWRMQIDNEKNIEIRDGINRLYWLTLISHIVWLIIYLKTSVF